MSCIEITAQQFANLGAAQDRSHTVEARLLTDEIRRLIERQNIDCSDINSIRWPVMGMNRHAVAKVLLLKTDVLNLITFGNPGSYSVPSGTGFAGVNFGNGTQPQSEDQVEYRITFADDLTNQATYFSRMYLAGVQPLVASAFGNLTNGEALYILTFKCFRWMRRSMRFLPGDYSEQGIEIGGGGELLNSAGNGVGYSYSSEAMRTVNQFWKFAVAPKSQSSPSDAMQEEYAYGTSISSPWDGADEKLQRRFATPLTDAIRLYFASIPGSEPLVDHIVSDMLAIPMRIGRGDHMPYQALVDKVLQDTATLVHTVIPFGLPTGRGQFGHGLMNLGRASGTFLESNRDRIVAGSINGNLVERMNLSAETRKFVVPSQLAAQAAPPVMVGGYRRPKPNGYPPAVFGEREGFDHEYITQSMKDGTGLIHGGPIDMQRPSIGLIDWEDYIRIQDRSTGTAGIDYRVASTLKNSMNNAPGMAYVMSDLDSLGGDFRDWARADQNLISGNPDFKNLGIRYQLAKQNHADIWFTGWLMPTRDDLEGWMQWIELRLQTDDKGFGFPTTRIWFDPDDPLVCPQPSDEDASVETLGLLRSWKGHDGRTRVALDWPFGIPCIAVIHANERITAGVDAWVYDCVFIAKKGYEDRWDHLTKGDKAEEYFGGLEDENVEVDLGGDRIYKYRAKAYNLAECANTGTFAAPGFKLPLAQPGFSVLPIGEDRDGNTKHVIVQGMLYWDDVGGASEPPRVYFCLANAIDGDCV
jgi:hypothetical protein